ncbi:MAG: Gfo/Idh/MocA family oxidoreductase [Fimbriimonadaceae bacterium]|nr:Gfo/Idh/MocA family oxidoreductase [Fimbriimonadaceae bacterium]
MQRLRLGVLGAGRGAGLARAVALAPSVELVAICDADETRRAAACVATGVVGLSDYQALLDSDRVDAVLVASPMPLHVAHSVQALAAGKHVLSEVTAATSLEDCWELLAAVRRSGLVYMLAENYCWYRPWSLVLALVRAGHFGEVYYGEAEQLQEFKGGFKPLDQGGTWRAAELAMRLGNHYITHHLGPLQMAVGQPITQVICHGSGQRHLPWAVADSTNTVLAETSGGAQFRLRLDFFSDRPNSYTYFGLQGTTGAYEAPRAASEEHRLYLHGRTAPGTWESLWNYADQLPAAWADIPPTPARETHDGGAPLMLEAFARAVLDGTPPPVDVALALNLTATGLLSELSRQRGGAPVEVPRFGLR